MTIATIADLPRRIGMRLTSRAISPEAGAVGGVMLWTAGLLFVYWPALRYPVFASDSPIDSAFFGYAGELVRRGGVPYLTFWDHKPPLIFLVDAAALALSGGQLWGLWLASLASLLGALLLAHRALRRVFGPTPAVIGLVVFASALSRSLPVNMTEGYVLPVQWGTALLLVGAATSPRGLARPHLVGIMLGVLGASAFFLRANLIGTAVSAALVLTVILLRARHPGAWVRLVGASVVGGMIVTALLLVPLWRAGALEAFWEQAFAYNLRYASTSLGMRVRSGMSGLLDVSTYGSLVLPLAGWCAAIAAAWQQRGEGARWAVPLFGVIWLPVELVLVTASGRPYRHYFAAVMPVLAYLSALAAGSLLGRLAPYGDELVGWGRRALGVVAVAMVVPAALSTAVRLRDREYPRVRSEQIAATAAYVQARTAPEATLLVWGHAADLHFFSGRRPASRFVYPLALLTPGYADSALVRGFLAELRAAPPPLIVDATPGAEKNDDLVPSLAAWDPDWKYPTSYGPRVQWWTMTPALRQFYEYVEQHYELDARVGPKQWVVYRRRVLPSVAASGQSSPAREQP
jgi:hypothetical protein